MLLKDPGTEPSALMRDLHQVATARLVRLMDGFYSNIEDGLFELAARGDDEYQQRRCFDLMRELRLRRSTLMNTFARVMDRNHELWFKPHSLRSARPDGRGESLEGLVMRMAKRSAGHFSGVLEEIAERASQLTGLSYAQSQDLPISPMHVSRAFVVSCRSLHLDATSIELVQQLFSRLVLDGLGNVYGEFNQALHALGYLTGEEHKAFARNRA